MQKSSLAVLAAFAIVILLALLVPATVFAEEPRAPVAASPAPAVAASAPRATSARPSPYSAPLSVPSAARIELPPVSVPAPAPAVPARPVFSSGCDGTGCWGSDGQRYNGAGGVLARPGGGTCRDVAGVLQCP